MMSENENEFQNFINEEANQRKEKAQKILLYHSIGAGAIGVIPGLDLAAQKFVIQKDAIKKIGQVFGLDINLIEKEKSLNIENPNSDDNFTIITPESNSRIYNNNSNSSDNNESISNDDNNEDNKKEDSKEYIKNIFTKVGQ